MALTEKITLAKIKKPISLYLHIPFCKGKCMFCDFFSVTEFNLIIIKDVLERILGEFDYYYSLIDKPPIQTLYIGGGSPGIVPIKMMNDFLSKLNKRIPDKPVEFTFESNPVDINIDFLSMLEGNNITRLSIGVQSFNNRLSGILGRFNQPENIARKIEFISKEWNYDLNIDIITEIPGETIGEAVDDIKRVISFSPEHISLYSLIFEENNPFLNHLNISGIKPLLDDIKEKMWIHCVELLKKRYVNYEISNFALNNKECIHNLNYWKLNPYLGIGPGAVSTLPGSDKIIRINNTKNIDNYLHFDDYDISIEKISIKDFFKENLIMSFRTEYGINLKTIRERFNMDILKLFHREIEEYVNNGYMSKTDTNVFFTEKGRLLLNFFLRKLLIKTDNIKFKHLKWP